MIASMAFTIGATSNSKGAGLQSIEEEEAQKKSWWRWATTNIHFVSLSSYALWMLVGTVWYKYYSDWTWATAYYYMIEAGLSVGFCYPAEKDDFSKLFTIFFVLLGSSIISGAVGLFATILFSNKISLVTVPHDVGAISAYETDGSVSLRSLSRCLWYHFKLSVGWYSNRGRTLLLAAFVLWMGLGTAYGMVFENWSFITSLYWAITSSSTGGLQSAPCVSGTDTTCDMGDVRGTLMGVFMMVGVPLYAAAIGQFANFTVSHALAAREQELLRRPIEDAEFLFAANILSPEGSTTLVCGEYILLELMRLGQTNQHQIEILKKRFLELDKEQRGELDIWDLERSGRVVPRKMSSVELARKLRTQSLEFFTAGPVKLRRDSQDGFVVVPPSPVPMEISSGEIELRTARRVQIGRGNSPVRGSLSRKKTFRKSLRIDEEETQAEAEGERAEQTSEGAKGNLKRATQSERMRDWLREEEEAQREDGEAFNDGESLKANWESQRMDLREGESQLETTVLNTASQNDIFADFDFEKDDSRKFPSFHIYNGDGKASFISPIRPFTPSSRGTPAQYDDVESQFNPYREQLKFNEKDRRALFVDDTELDGVALTIDTGLRPSGPTHAHSPSWKTDNVNGDEEEEEDYLSEGFVDFLAGEPVLDV